MESRTSEFTTAPEFRDRRLAGTEQVRGLSSATLLEPEPTLLTCNQIVAYYSNQWARMSTWSSRLSQLQSGGCCSIGCAPTKGERSQSFARTWICRARR